MFWLLVILALAARRYRGYGAYRYAAYNPYAYYAYDDFWW